MSSQQQILDEIRAIHRSHPTLGEQNAREMDTVIDCPFCADQRAQYELKNVVCDWCRDAEGRETGRVDLFSVRMHHESNLRRRELDDRDQDNWLAKMVAESRRRDDAIVAALLGE